MRRKDFKGAKECRRAWAEMASRMVCKLGAEKMRFEVEVEAYDPEGAKKAEEEGTGQEKVE